LLYGSPSFKTTSQRITRSRVQTIIASNTDPPLELAGIRVKVAGLDARILSVSPEDVRFIAPDGVEAADKALVQLTTVAVATDVAGREEDIIVNATFNGEDTRSQSVATIAFKDPLYQEKRSRLIRKLG